MTRTCLITGGSRGLGAAIARGFGARRDDVALTYHRQAALATGMVANLRHLGRRSLAVRYELYDFDSAAEAVALTVAESGRLDTIVVNAGTWQAGLVDSRPATEWWRVIENKLRGAHQLIVAALLSLSLDEITAAAAFLAEDATFTTGSVLTVNGGWSL